METGICLPDRLLGGGNDGNGPPSQGSGPLGGNAGASQSADAGSAVSNLVQNNAGSGEDIANGAENSRPNTASNIVDGIGRRKRQAAGPGPGPGPGQGPILGSTQDSVNKEYEFLGMISGSVLYIVSRRLLDALI